MAKANNNSPPGEEIVVSPATTASNGNKDPQSKCNDNSAETNNTHDKQHTTTTSHSINKNNNDKHNNNTTTTNVETNNNNDDSSITNLTENLRTVSLTASSSEIVPTSPPPPPPPAIQHFASLLSSNKYRNIVILTGAGVSCNAGIPDFRTPGTGLYDNLQKYNLPFPEAVFDVNFYRKNPAPFVQLASELWPGIKHSPTITHSFIALLEKKGMLLRNYTQNIDMLEVLAGVSEDKIVECHGHFRTASCIQCPSPFDGKECQRIIVEDKSAPSCRKCGGLVKPDIVFFGEGLPDRFHRLLRQDMRKADLVLVMGTSLMVGPVNMIPDMVSKTTPRVLLNRELVGTFLRRGGVKTRKKNYDKTGMDTFQEGDCDESIRSLCTLLGWEEELDSLNSSTRLG